MTSNIQLPYSVIIDSVSNNESRNGVLGERFVVEHPNEVDLNMFLTIPAGVSHDNIEIKIINGGTQIQWQYPLQAELLDPKIAFGSFQFTADSIQHFAFGQAIKGLQSKGGNLKTEVLLLLPFECHCTFFAPDGRPCGDFDVMRSNT